MKMHFQFIFLIILILTIGCSGKSEVERSSPTVTEAKPAILTKVEQPISSELDPAKFNVYIVGNKISLFDSSFSDIVKLIGSGDDAAVSDDGNYRKASYEGLTVYYWIDSAKIKRDVSNELAALKKGNLCQFLLTRRLIRLKGGG
jgi:hypothetical protein